MNSLPTVNANGDVLIDDALSASSGQLLAVRHGGTDVLHQYPAQVILDASDSSCARLLLGYARQTRADRRRSAAARAVVYAMVALLPALFVTGSLRGIVGRPVALGGFICIMIATAARGFWVEFRKPGGVWELSQWLDLNIRAWRSRKVYLDGSRNADTALLSLDSLCLVCFTHSWEQGNSYDVGLCTTERLRTRQAADEYHLNILHSSDSEAASIEFARALASRWNIECWHQKLGLNPTLTRIASVTPEQSAS